MSDPDQKSTYAAEDLVEAWLDASLIRGGEVTVTLKHAGSAHSVTYNPETEPRFSDPHDVSGFVTLVMARLRDQAGQFGSNYRDREFKPVHVREGRSFKKATYRDGVIFLPTRKAGGAWALRGFVVLHELAHHLNTGVDGTIIDHHGEGFRDTFVKILEDIGWTEIASMLRDAYREIGLDQQHPADEGMLAKVGKLLRHAEGASTEAERDAFFSKAQELATAHSIELAVARAAHEKGEAELSPTFESIRLGHRGQPSNVRFVSLMLAIARANDLRCSIRGDNTGVSLFGFPGDIEVTKALYATLAIQMVADADAYIRSGAHRPVHGRTARAAFYQGWTSRIGQRLTEAKQYATDQAAALNKPDPSRDETLSTSTALALKAKEVEVDDYYEYMKRQQGVRGTWRGGSQINDSRSAARGRAAANRARLGSEKAIAT
ncbi:MAG: DUF2786 domain-containing protein [Actinomycetales bacterium]|nr:DUF2786 domain-containing protein [Actinomycetales bacterium]